MLSESSKQIFEYLIRHIEDKSIRIGDPRTYVFYSDIHKSLGFEKVGKTFGESLDTHGMGELAEWIKNSGLPAITGLIVSKTEKENRPAYLPGSGYFKLYERPDMDGTWWTSQIRSAVNFDWREALSRKKLNVIYPDEISNNTQTEGAKKKVLVNAYERSSIAREQCISHWGLSCQCCDFNFSRIYGEEIGSGFIHVHHVVPLSEINDEYEVDPINDLIPLCPNCHAMVHKTNPPMKVSKLKEFIALNKSSN